MSAINNIHNYYESLVADEIRYRIKEEYPAVDADVITDISCVALNRLPARYIRHEVDLAFYLTQDELLEMRKNVANAVSYAFKFVLERRQREALNMP